MKQKNLITVKKVCDNYENSGWGLFSFAHGMPKLQEKIKFEILDENNEKFIAMKLAPFLGLPGDEDFKSELNDLKEFLIWIKEKGLETPTNDLRVILDAVGKQATLLLDGKNKELTAKLEKEMFEKINQSDNLTKWLENQKEGIVNTKGELFDLMAIFPAAALMRLEERTEYYKLQKPIKKDHRPKYMRKK